MLPSLVNETRGHGSLSNPFALVESRSTTLRACTLAWMACIFFIAAGHAFVPLLGIEDDEALFAKGLYHPRAELYSLKRGNSQIPIMLMNYLGCLKTWLYGPIFK